MKNNYVITYDAYDRSGKAIAKSKKMRVKNKDNAVAAQVGLEALLKKKCPDFGRLIVISCIEENPFMSMFGDILGKDNPFNF